MEFYEVLKAECDRQHIPVSKAVLEAGEKLGSLSGWKKGASPNSKAVIALADYLHVSVDYLLGRSAPAELPDDAAELLSIFNRLNPQMKALLLSMAHNVLNSQEPASEPTYIFDDDPTYWRKEG